MNYKKISVSVNATKELLDKLNDDGSIPFCQVCGKCVDVGGQVDHCFPYVIDGNRCSEHRIDYDHKELVDKLNNYINYCEEQERSKY